MAIDISIIIPTCNRNDLLSECLDSIAPGVQSIKDNYQVIVTDDSKESAARDIIDEKYKWVKWVKGPQKGPAANRNNGASYADGQWLIFIDDDCLPNKNLLLGYENGIKAHPEILVFEGCTIVDRPKNKFNEEAPLNTTGGYLFGCNFAINTDYFRQLYGFDEKFPYPAMEDSELAYRIKRQGVKLFFLKDAIAMHPWRTKQNSFKMTLKRFSSALYFIEKHPQERHNLGFIYYLRSFYHSVVDTFGNCVRFRFRGFAEKIIYDFMQLYFAFYMLFFNGKQRRDLK
jgi:GT2 family glycosyltransferase